MTISPARSTRPPRGAGPQRAVSVDELRAAISRDELNVAYQPQFELASGRIAGLEALVRWDHPRLGPVAPGEFLGLAEDSGLIIELDTWVLKQACADLARWHAKGFTTLRVATNLSVATLAAPGLCDTAQAATRRNGIAPNRLEVEITESAPIRQAGPAVAALHRLREDGVLVALDDFGTGYSMLDRLRTLPFDALKIDRSFVAGLDQPSGPQLLSAAIALGHGLGLRLVAEGVETTAQLAFLEQNRCDEVQGYLLSRPLRREQIHARLGAPGLSLTAPPADPVPRMFSKDSAALERLVRPLLAELGRLTDLESTYLTMIDEVRGEQLIVFARNAADLRIDEGRRIAWKDTICKRSLETGIRCTSDVGQAFPDSPAGRELGLRTYAGVPVLRSDGRVWGTLCGASVHRRTVGEPTLTVMEAFARLAAAQLEMNGWSVPTLSN